jgi:hypothetical protein
MPSDGEARTAAAQNVPDQGMADDIARLAAGTHAVIHHSRVYTDWQYYINPLSPVSQANHWVRLPSAVGFAQTDVVSADVNEDTKLWCPLDMPDGATLTAIEVRLHPNGGHSALPATMPTFNLYEIDPSADSSSSVAAGTDASANTTAYQLNHTILVNGLSHVIDRNNRGYKVTFSGEYGANALTLLHALAVICHFDTTKIDRGAG